MWPPGFEPQKSSHRRRAQKQEHRTATSSTEAGAPPGPGWPPGKSRGRQALPATQAANGWDRGFIGSWLRSPRLAAQHPPGRHPIQGGVMPNSDRRKTVLLRTVPGKTVLRKAVIRNSLLRNALPHNALLCRPVRGPGVCGKPSGVSSCCATAPPHQQGSRAAHTPPAAAGTGLRPSPPQRVPDQTQRSISGALRSHLQDTMK